MKSVCSQLDAMIAAMSIERIKPEHIIMGRDYCMQWLTELARHGDFAMDYAAKKYKFTYKGIPVIICESALLEVVPNPKFML